MALLGRKKSRQQAGARADAGPHSLADDVRGMRSALTGMHGEHSSGGNAEVNLRGLTSDLLTGEVAAPTSDIAWLISHNTDPGTFYEKELAPSWEGLGEDQRAARIDGFVDLAKMLDESPADGVPEEMVATVHTKTLLLAFAFDETYGYMGQIAANA